MIKVDVSGFMTKGARNVAKNSVRKVLAQPISADTMAKMESKSKVSSMNAYCSGGVI